MQYYVITRMILLYTHMHIRIVLYKWEGINVVLWTQCARIALALKWVFISALSATFLMSIVAYLFTKQVLSHVLVRHVKYDTFDTSP